MGLLDGKVAIVTGAGRGIGRGEALELAAHGAMVVVSDLGASLMGDGSDTSPAAETARLIEKAGGRAVVNTGDVSSWSDMEAVVKQIFAVNQIEISDTMPLKQYRDLLKSVPALFDMIEDQGWNKDDGRFAVGVEFILEGLAVTQRLSRRKLGEIVSFKSVDIY